MDKQARLFLVLSLCMIFGAVLPGCGEKGYPPAKPTFPVVLAEETVTVAGGGGGANVTFSGSSGWSVRITLTGTPSTMIPYGFLEWNGTYQPPQETAKNGQNSVVLTLTQTGLHSITVFDGENKGGKVTVKVERLS